MFTPYVVYLTLSVSIILFSRSQFYARWYYLCVFVQSSVEITKRQIRMISQSKYNAHTEPLLKELDLLKLSDLLELSALKFLKYPHRSLPRLFYSFNIAIQGTQHSHDTRQCDQLRIDRSRINLADNRILIFFPNLVNSTPADLLHKIKTHSIHGFLSYIKRYYIINRYRDNSSNTNCYLCQH